MRHHVYLHGFASSPASRKATALAARFAAAGLELQRPDLNRPSFESLTATRMVEQTARLLRDLGNGPAALIGSSLGAFVALHVAEQAAALGVDVDRLVLLAPALTFGARPSWLSEAELARWHETGWLELTHHGDGVQRRIHHDLLVDARRYDAFSTSAVVPTLVVQGARDEVVDPVQVQRWSRARDHVRLVLLDDDHGLAASVDRIWDEVRAFLAGPDTLR